MSQKALTFCPNAVGSAAFQQQQQLRLPVYLMCNLRRWTCYFPSLLLNMRRAAGAWSYFWGSLPRLAHPWLDEGMPQSTADPFRGAVSQPQLNQQSAMLVCTWRKAPYGVWMASQHSPSCPGVEPKSQAGGGHSAEEGSMPGRQHSPVCAPSARIHSSWLPSASSSIWPNVLSSFCLFCSNSFLANTILRVVLILIDEAGAQSCLGMVRHYLSRKINSHVHSSSFQKMKK